MTEVLKALVELHVLWEQIGPYKLMCRRVVGVPGHHGGMVNNYAVQFEVQVVILVFVAFRFK